MKTKNLLRKAFLLLALVGGINSAWADTETPGNTGSSNTDVVGKSYTIDGTYVAGSGSASVTPMVTKGVKLRTNKTSNTLVISVNEGYRIDALTVYGISNDNTKTVTVDEISVDGESYSTDDIVIPNKKASTAATISITDIAAKDNITFAFSTNAGTQINWDFHFTYTQEEVITQEITGVSLNGSAISSEDIATLKSTNALTIDGSSFNGLGTLAVSLSSGSTTVERAIDGNNAVYTFSINSGADEYTITVTGVAKTYSAEGSVVYFSKNSTDAEGVNTKTVVANGISMTMVDGSKSFQYGAGSVTLGSDKYVPLKLSTGSAVNVTFPDGKVATKVIVYGWSVNGNGKFASMGETSELTKSVDVSGDVFYATNTATDTYPSVYEYDLDNWESFYFNPTGSPSQPFVVLDFVLEDKPTAVSATVTEAGYATFVPAYALDFTSTSIKAYKVKVSAKGVATMTQVDKVPAGTPVLLYKKGGATEDIPVIASADAVSDNDLVAGTGAAVATDDGDYTNMILNNGSDGIGFYFANGQEVAKNRAYLHIAKDLAPDAAGSARGMRLEFAGNITGINEAAQAAEAAEKEGKFVINGQLVIKKNGKKFNAAGQIVK